MRRIVEVWSKVIGTRKIVGPDSKLVLKIRTLLLVLPVVTNMLICINILYRWQFDPPSKQLLQHETHPGVMLI